METEMVRQVAAKVLGIDPRAVADDALLTEHLGADSLDLLKMAAELEEQMQLVIDRKALLKANTVRELARLLH
ncbi:MAG: phosphopantetheine-binding protein [Lachnospiraceae bacterium]|nr:phosphopantetheine-binding protein [Lachnospiraceae bacterium]